MHLYVCIKNKGKEKEEKKQKESIMNKKYMSD